MKFISLVKSALVAGSIALSASASAAVPNSISFDNLTDIQLDAYTAGEVGASIDRQSSNFSVPFIGVMARCNMGGVPTNCPIEFYDHDNGLLIGTVYMNILDASVVSAPQLTPEYSDKIELLGWDTVPVTNIRIVSK